MIELKNVTVSRSGSEVLREFSMHAPKGSMTVIFGGSGSGKSTICDVILGKVQVQSGTVELNSAAVSQNTVSAISPSIELLGDRTVRENIGLPLEITGVTRNRLTSMVDAVIQRFGLGEIASEQPSAITGGARQKSAIARAVVSEPLILVADEPTLHLDRTASKEIAEALTKEQMRGMTVIVLTSDPAFKELFPGAAHVNL